MSYNEILKTVNVCGLEKYRTDQIIRWMNRGIFAFNEMTDISKPMQIKLSDIFQVDAPCITDKAVSSDGTVKYLFRLHDGNIIESVRMKYEHGDTSCISSQVGCRMGCRFCASFGLPFIRDLTSGEMFAQVAVMNRDLGIRTGNVVIMGIGEPLDNYDNVIGFIKRITSNNGLNIGARRISLSTCGLVPEIIKLSSEGIPLTLSISLHSVDDGVRSMLMPVNRRYSIDKIIEACKIYTDKTRRRISFEYALLSNINDSAQDAVKLAGLLKGMLCHVNLIPLNAVKGMDFQRSGHREVEQFKKILLDNSIQVTVRRELGNDIEAACGQLRRRFSETEGRIRSGGNA